MAIGVGWLRRSEDERGGGWQGRTPPSPHGQPTDGQPSAALPTCLFNLVSIEPRRASTPPALRRRIDGHPKALAPNPFSFHSKRYYCPFCAADPRSPSTRSSHRTEPVAFWQPSLQSPSVNAFTLKLSKSMAVATRKLVVIDGVGGVLVWCSDGG